MVTGSEGRGVKQAPVPRARGRRDAGGARRGGLHQQPRRGEAAGLGRLPGEDRRVARARHRAVPQGALRASWAGRRRRPPRAPRDAAPGERPDGGGPRRPPGHGGPHRAALGGAPARAGRVPGGGGARREETAPAPRRRALRRGPARRISVRLYFEAPDREGLLPEEREVAFSADLARQLRTVVEELAKGSTTGLVATLPAGTRVLEVFVQARGVAYVDLSSEAASGLPGGSQAELLTVYSVVNTLVTNFPAVSRVQILVNDQPVTSLGGHVDLSRPLPPDMTLRRAAVARARRRRTPSPRLRRSAEGGPHLSTTLALALALALAPQAARPVGAREDRGGRAAGRRRRCSSPRRTRAAALAQGPPRARGDGGVRAHGLRDRRAQGRGGRGRVPGRAATRTGSTARGCTRRWGPSWRGRATPSPASRYLRRAFLLDPTPDRGLALARSLNDLGRGREAIDTVQRAIAGLAGLKPEAAEVIARAADVAGLPSAQAEIDRGRLKATLGKAVELREGPLELPPGVAPLDDTVFRLDDAPLTVVLRGRGVLPQLLGRPRGARAPGAEGRARRRGAAGRRPGRGAAPGDRPLQAALAAAPRAGTSPRSSR